MLIEPTDRASILFLFYNEIDLRVTLKRCSPFKKAFEMFARRRTGCIEDFEFRYSGRKVSEFDTFEGLHMNDGDTIKVTHHQVGGKPVIYLFSPTEITVSVSLRLLPEWSFSAIYPVVPVKSSATVQEEYIHWDVKIYIDGSLTETNTGQDVAYLFWEARYVLWSFPSLSKLRNEIGLSVGPHVRNHTQHFQFLLLKRLSIQSPPTLPTPTPSCFL